ICWDEFACPLTDVRGTLVILPKHWEFRDFRGRNHGGEIFVSGRATAEEGSIREIAQAPDLLTNYPQAPAPLPAYRIELDVNGRNVSLGDDLRGALRKMPALVRTWNAFQPSGHVHFTAKVDRLPPRPDRPLPAIDMDVAVEALDCAVEPQFFKYALT